MRASYHKVAYGNPALELEYNWLVITYKHIKTNRFQNTVLSEKVRLFVYK